MALAGAAVGGEGAGASPQPVASGPHGTGERLLLKEKLGWRQAAKMLEVIPS